MSEKLDALLSEIQQFPTTVEEALLVAEANEIVDVLGEVNATEGRVRQSKLRAASEVSDGDAGRQWEFQQKRSARRTYNTSGLLAVLMEKMEIHAIAPLLTRLMQLDVIRLQWQWSKLKALSHEYNIHFDYADHAVTDGDSEADIGEVWTHGQPRYVFLGHVDEEGEKP